MTFQAFPQTTIALICDFDDTLISGSMQSPIFEAYEVNEHEFWDEVNGLSTYYADARVRVSQSSAYLNHMLTYVQYRKFPGLNNKKLEELGSAIEFYQGVTELFPRLKKDLLACDEFQKYGIVVEIYVVSSGLVRMINGSAIALYLDGVWGCEFIEEVAMPGYTTSINQPSLIENDPELRQVGFIVDDTTKTRAIFEINKGVNTDNNIDVNAQIPHEHRRVPFNNMIYIGDGPSDIPVFSLLNQYGGRTYAVYKPGSARHFDRVYRLRHQDRIEAYGPADYREGTQTSMWIESTVTDIARRIVDEKERVLQSAVQQPPGHVVPTTQPVE